MSSKISRTLLILAPILIAITFILSLDLHAVAQEVEKEPEEVQALSLKSCPEVPNSTVWSYLQGVSPGGVFDAIGSYDYCIDSGNSLLEVRNSIPGLRFDTDQDAQIYQLQEDGLIRVVPDTLKMGSSLIDITTNWNPSLYVIYTNLCLEFPSEICLDNYHFIVGVKGPNRTFLAQKGGEIIFNAVREYQHFEYFSYFSGTLINIGPFDKLVEIRSSTPGVTVTLVNNNEDGDSFRLQVPADFEDCEISVEVDLKEDISFAPDRHLYTTWHFTACNIYLPTILK